MAVEKEPVGITTTVPVEAVFAAGFKPVDLNNVFVSDPDPDALVETALREGFPQNSCAWIKGIFGAVAGQAAMPRVIGVVRGDCSGTELLLELFEARGIEVIPFSYPYPPSRREMEREMSRLCEALGTTLEEADAWREKLAGARQRVARVDRECWEGDRVHGAEAHLWLVSSSDFQGDVAAFTAGIDSFLESVEARDPIDRRGGMPYGREVRLGYLGVPPITPGVYDLAESLGARFVFHEVQRQYSMPPDTAPAGDLVQQYLDYTYPYTVAKRARDINRQAKKRRLDGVVHYVQSFCHRNLEDVLFRRLIQMPMLTVECDCPGTLGASARSRLENFVQVLGENQ